MGPVERPNDPPRPGEWESTRPTSKSNGAAVREVWGELGYWTGGEDQVWSGCDIVICWDMSWVW